MGNPYTSVSISGYADGSPPNDGSRTQANRVNYDELKADLTDPIKTAVESVNSNASSAIGVVDGRIQTENALYNGGFRVAQDGAGPFTATTSPANNDDTYVLDGWTLISDGNDIVDVSQETTRVPAGSYASCKLDIETADKKFGVISFLTADDSRRILDGKCSLSVKLSKDGTTIDTARAAVLGWKGTADSITSDPVTAWNGDGAAPTLATDWEYLNTTVDITVGTATTFAETKIENIATATDATNNVAVMVISNTVSATVGDVLYVADVVLHPGAVAQTYYRPTFSEELRRNQRLYATIDVSTTNGDLWIGFPMEMRATPSITATAGTATDISTNGFRLNHTTTATTTIIADARL